MPSPRRKKLLGCLALLLAAAAAAAAAGAWWSTRFLASPYQGYPGDERVVVIAPGTPSTRILEQLEAAGVVADARLLRLYLVLGLGSPPLQAGEYRFAGPATPRRVLDKLIRGEVMDHPVTIVEGLTLEETADALVAAGLGGRDAFLAAMRDPAAIADLDPGADTLEGYLFPSTYRFVRGTAEADIVATLVRTFREAWQREVEPVLAAAAPGPAAPAAPPAAPPQDGLDGAGGPPGDAPAEAAATAGAETAGGGAVAPPGPAPRSVHDVVILASVVEKEAKVDRERPLIAGVYANRLARGIALYADPTVIYALKRLDRWDGNLTRENLRTDSPYNTYRNPGLPPGPICSPGLASLRAAADPADVPYLYFVSRNDGTHVFSTNIAEHNRNVTRWQRRRGRRGDTPPPRHADGGGAPDPRAGDGRD